MVSPDADADGHSGSQLRGARNWSPLEPAVGGSAHNLGLFAADVFPVAPQSFLSLANNTCGLPALADCRLAGNSGRGRRNGSVAVSPAQGPLFLLRGVFCHHGAVSEPNDPWPPGGRTLPLFLSILPAGPGAVCGHGRSTVSATAFARRRAGDEHRLSGLKFISDDFVSASLAQRRSLVA